MALEELLEGEIEQHGGTDTVGLVFVERRITAMALHNYFLWRESKIDHGAFARANAVRPRALEMLPQMRCFQDWQGNQFDDSAEDPFVAFQLSQKERPKDQASLAASAAPRGSLCNDHQSNDQFMDADDDSLPLCGRSSGECSRDCHCKRLDHNKVHEQKSRKFHGLQTFACSSF